jgi:hypothetical protein
MHHTPDAGYLCGNRHGCLKGTRKEVLLQIEQWLMDEKDRRIFWLNGLAGTGKSTIAQTFSEISFADRKLGASFFCSRDFDDRSNLQTIFPTLARSIKTGDSAVATVRFSPADSLRLISLSGDRIVRQWAVDGRQIGPSLEEAHPMEDLA